jgi:DMSO/TMAO reductase YedYZ molybdopterin-dependent catalytic subunit
MSSRLFLLGTVCGSVAVVSSFVVRIFFGGVYLPELASEALFSLVPGFLESRAVENLGPLAKESAFLGASIINVVVLAFIPVLVSRFRLLPGGRPRKATVYVALSYLVMVFLAFIFLALAQVVSSPVTLPSVFEGLLVPSVVFGVLLGAARPGPPAKPPATYPTERMKGKLDRRRRLFIRGAAGTVVAGAILYLGLQLLFSGKSTPQDTTDETATVLASQVTPNSEFYRVDVNVIPPSVDSGTWSLNVHGLVNSPATLTYDQLMALPSVEEYATLECVSNKLGGDLMSTAKWKGVRLGDVLNAAGVAPGADYVVFRCYDGYDVGIPLDRAMMDGTILAYEMNGVPLPVEHGFPLRAIVPGLYGMMNAKWITEIELRSGIYQGFWQRMGWENDAHYQTSSNILTPGDSPLRDRFPVPLSVTNVVGSMIGIDGVAFAGDRGISKVEVSTDGGGTWEQASLQDPLSNLTWVFWKYEWNPPGGGNYSLMVRATDGTGAVQVATVTDPFPNGATGYQVIDVQVSNS